MIVSRASFEFTLFLCYKLLTYKGLVVLALSLVGCTPGLASDGEVAAYRDRFGALAAAETSASTPRGRYALSRVRLTSSTGLVATGRLLRPDTGRCHPAVLLQNGREENSAVIGRLPEEFGDVVVLSLDYPDEMPMAIQLRDVVGRGDQLERAASEIPSLFLMGAAYLAQRPDVDSTRMALAATSFAVPFAAIAAAADERFRNVALVYGAGDLAGVLAANLRIKPEFLRGPAIVARDAAVRRIRAGALRPPSRAAPDHHGERDRRPADAYRGRERALRSGEGAEEADLDADGPPDADGQRADPDAGGYGVGGDAGVERSGIGGGIVL